MADVLNRQTLELKRSVNTPDYPESEWVINPDLTITQTVPWDCLRLVGDRLVEFSPEEKSVVNSNKLAELRLKYLSIVNSACEEYIIKGPGVEFPVGSGKRLSVSTNAQIKWMGWVGIADQWEAMGMSYPFKVRTVDDSDFVEINNADDVRMVFALMAQFIAAVLGFSEIVKSEIILATTIEQIIMITDAYLVTVPLRE